MYAKYREQGLEILAFPCNQFLGQEPGSNAEIKARVAEKYAIKFKLFSKIDVNGEGTHNIYKFLRSAPLKNQKPDSNQIEWNFQKYIVTRDGQVCKRYGPNVDPVSFDVPEKMPAWLVGTFD